MNQGEGGRKDTERRGSRTGDSRGGGTSVLAQEGENGTRPCLDGERDWDGSGCNQGEIGQFFQASGRSCITQR